MAMAGPRCLGRKPQGRWENRNHLAPSRRIGRFVANRTRRCYSVVSLVKVICRLNGTTPYTPRVNRR